MLIRHAELEPGTLVDIRLDHAGISEIGNRLPHQGHEMLIEAHGCGLLVGLHDHHMHLMAYAAALESIPCGPPHTCTPDALAGALIRSAARRRNEGAGWLRGINYHESVAGDLDRDWLDRAVPDMPLRIQHRSGRLWVFNSRALEALGATDENATDPLERIGGRLTGRLYDADTWMRSRIPASRPTLTQASRTLASYGVTGVTDAGVHNGPRELALFAAARRNGSLLQDMLVMGDARLDGAQDAPGIWRGPTKLYLREPSLPVIEDFCTQIRRSHRAGRPVAIHCVTRVELLFALTALNDCGQYPGDRIEHASVTPPEALELLATQKLTTVTQPNFVHERGDAYLADVAPDDLPWLYRGRGFIEAGIALAAGTDAPYGHANPWLAMAAAVDRKTALGHTLVGAEALSPREAVQLFTGPADAPGQASRGIRVGAKADLCLLDRPWRDAYADLASVHIKATIKDGQPIWLA